MTDSLLAHDWLQKLASYCTLFVGFSGGLDSTVLLHSLAQQPALAGKLQAVHIHHGLSVNADSWQAHCQQFCETHAIPLAIHQVEFERGSNIEEGARIARYQVFSSFLADNDCLLLAHHRDDQAETLLLQLLRGTGIDGLAAMADCKTLGQGSLLRPLLNHSRRDLETYAWQHDLRWVDDESNQNLAFSRNFLRHQIMPLLQEKWPGVVGNLARTAMHCQQAKLNLEALAEQDCIGQNEPGDTLDLSSLTTLSHSRLINVLRFWLKKNHIRLPSTTILDRLINEVIFASPDATPSVQWGDVIIRRYQQTLYVLTNQITAMSVGSVDNSPRERQRPATCSRDPRILLIGRDHSTEKDKTGSREQVAGRRSLNCQQHLVWNNFPEPLDLGNNTSLCAARSEKGLAVADGARVEVRYRQGGELFRWHGQTKKLKKLLQEWRVPPWQRDYIPLIYIDNRLAAIVGFAASDEGEEGLRVNQLYRIELYCGVNLI